MPILRRFFSRILPVNKMDFSNPSSVLDLANIRETLTRLEDTILFNLIERAQFFTSPSIYNPTAIPIPNWSGSFFDWVLFESECIQSKVRRYQSPDEEPFTPRADLPASILPSLNYPHVLAWYTNEVNINEEIKELYIKQIVPLVAAGDQDQSENFGSTALADLECLQALSRRIHFGKFVAESKFQSETELFTKLILERDARGIEQAITKPEVEARILDRIEKKAETYGVDPTLRWSEKPQGKVDPKAVRRIYEEWIIPLTRKVEVDYLLRRLESETK
ncbi:uncharacterized protein SAPINGB_P002876 [Magnusiomyces paraingens]|uniref:Chorismate mutase n=1 Tax=Magnusiomyces paraingens TaxID=2606893 RepID=A0A5E8BMN8_9ASCO|nr:uncharacterized protein SAPINGB_P002876 [Saprochaete ingens]VVT50775.1 unnamed protein product [Saprochaete ingens]